VHAGFFELDHLLSYQNVLVILAAWSMIQTGKLLFPTFFASERGKKWLVLLPGILCQIAVWGTMRWQPDASVGERVVLGIVLATFTAHAHDVLRRFGISAYVPVLGQEKRPRD